MTIRRATAADAEAIAAVLRDASTGYRSAYTQGGYRATVLTADEIATRLAEGPVWLALRAGAVAGTAAAVEREHGVYVRSMAVLPAAQGSGIAWALLEHLERYARERDARRLYLSTTPFLQRAIALYERFGFGRTGETSDLHGTPLFTMAKEIVSGS